LARYLLRAYDRRTVLQIGAVSLILAMFGLSLAMNFWVFLFFSFLFGLSLGIVGLVPNVLVPLGSSAEKKQQLLAGLHAMYGVASFLSPLIAAGMQWWMGTWRWTFAVTSIAPLSLILYSLHSSHRDLHKKTEMTAESRRHHHRMNFKPQMHLALMVSFCVAAEILVSSRLALYMRRAWNYDMEQSSLYVTYFFVALLVGRGLFAIVKLPMSLRRQLSGSLVLSAIFFFFGLHWHPLFLALIGFSVAPFYPLSIAWISSRFPHDLDTAVSYMMTTDSVMLVLMHLLVGKVTDDHGIGRAFYLGPVFLLFSFILANTFEMTVKPRRARPT
ncbi:MAG TPA: MFS transporter, partial [Bdellovibrio sp.]|nr:MFS transporter [Bdellovibrio sp.]